MVLVNLSTFGWHIRRLNVDTYSSTMDHMVLVDSRIWLVLSSPYTQQLPSGYLT